MLNSLFSSVLADGMTATAYLICTATALVLGVIIAAANLPHNRTTKSFVMTLAILPAIVQVVIMLVNGNLGTGVAVMGAFSLVRFRSVPGTAWEIGSIFLAMSVGLACGMGYLGIAAITAIMLSLITLLYSSTRLGEGPKSRKELRVTIPESLDYTDVFEELLEKYTTQHELIRVKTTNLGSLYQLWYRIELRDEKRQKEMLDAIRCLNGNLDIQLGRQDSGGDEL